jgi:hypothetical protein
MVAARSLEELLQAMEAHPDTPAPAGA